MPRRKSRVVKLIVVLVVVVLYVIVERVGVTNSSWPWSTLFGLTKHSTSNEKIPVLESSVKYISNGKAPVIERVTSKETRKNLQRIGLQDSVNSLKRTAVNFSAIELNDVFISVKTTEKFHHDRLNVLLRTWFKIAKDQTYIFTDSGDEDLNVRANGHLINTRCSAIHTRWPAVHDVLSRLKLNEEKGCAVKCQPSLTTLLSLTNLLSDCDCARWWFCHVDDDTYVNIPSLMRVLRSFRYNEDWYIGRPSLIHPLSIMHPENREKRYSYWFATGGAGFCLSRGLALKMVPVIGDGKLMTVCEARRLPDDCAIGFVISYNLHVNLTVVNGFHSHLERLSRIGPAKISAQVTVSYALSPANTVSIPGFNLTEDPTRFLSVHCFLFPDYSEKCPPRRHHLLHNARQTF